MPREDDLRGGMLLLDHPLLYIRSSVCALFSNATKLRPVFKINILNGA